MVTPLFDLQLVDDEVVGITFASPPAPASTARLSAGIDHLGGAEALWRAGARVASIIVVADALEPDLWVDERFASWIAQAGLCEARVEARRRLARGSLGPNQMDDRAAELGFPPRGGSDGEHPEYWPQVRDAVADEFEMIELVRYLDEERLDCAVEWIDDEPHDLDEDEAARRWSNRLRGLIAPQPQIRHRRRYHLPPPLDAWDERNRLQQWYFVEDAAGVTHQQGGSASSGQRETHGRWAHTFATLERDHDVRAPTAIVRYDARNVLRPVRSSQSLLVDRTDITGNYGVDRAESEKLLRPFVIDAHAK